MTSSASRISTSAPDGGGVVFVVVLFLHQNICAQEISSGIQFKPDLISCGAKMVVQKFSVFIASAALSVLAACSSNEPALTAAPVAAAPALAPAAFSRSSPQQQADATLTYAGPVANTGNTPRVTESERRAEELRMVDFEQSFSIEMHRRSDEQAERAQRALVAQQAGVVQGPGCEGTQGEAALVCERSLL
jgi:hypothetical protein